MMMTMPRCFTLVVRDSITWYCYIYYLLLEVTWSLVLSKTSTTQTSRPVDIKLHGHKLSRHEAD